MAQFDPENAGVPVTTPDRSANAFDPETAGEPVGNTRTSSSTTPMGTDRFTRFTQENERSGIPLDLDTPLPASIRARVSVENRLDKQLDLLRRQEGIEEARLSTDGKNIIATVKDPAGAKKDVLLYPASGVNVAGNASGLGKAAIATGLALTTGGASLPATAAILGGGTAAVDALSKEASRLESGMELDPRDLARSAAIEGGINAGLPLAGAATTKIAGLLSRGAGALEKGATEAAGRLAVPITPAQATGSGALARSAALSGGAPLAAEQTAALKAATDRQLGLSGANAVPTEAEIAKRVQPLVAANADAAEAGVAAVTRDAGKAAQAEIQAQLDRQLIPTNATQSDAGALIRSKVEAARDIFQAEAEKNFGKVYQLAEKENLQIPVKPVSDLAAKISAEDPKAALQQLVPELGQIQKVAAQLGGTDQATMTLKEARALRTAVNNKINFDVAIGENGKRYLKDLATSLKTAIDQGLAKASPELRTANDVANTAYAKNVGKFTDADVGKLFADPDTSRHLADNEIIPALFRGKGNLDALQSYRDVLGANSPEYKLLLRQGFNSLLEEAGTSGGLLNADRFLARLNGLSSEMRTEALGASADAVANNARILAAAKGAKIDPVDLETALKAAPGQAPKLFQAAVARQAAVDREYGNRVIKGIRDGTFGDQTVQANPDTFVTRFLSNASADDTRKVMAQLGDKTKEMIRQRTFSNILDDVRANPAVGQATTGENTAINPTKLVQNYLVGSERAKYEAVLGREGIQFLDDVATIQEAMAKEGILAGTPGYTERALGFLGRFAGGDVIGGSVGRTAGKTLAYVPKLILGNAQRAAPVRQFLITGEFPQLPSAVRAGILASPEAEKAREESLAKKPLRRD